MKIPKSKAELKRPVDKRHALLRIEKENVWIRSLNRQLAENLCALITRGDPVTVERSSGVIVWGIYAGESDKTGTIILDHKPDDRFKLVPMDVTPNSLLTQLAHFVARQGSVSSVEGKRGLVFHGELRSPVESVETKTAVQEPKPEVAPAGDKASTETVKIPKSQAELKRPVGENQALLRIEKENVWVRSLNRQLAESFCALVTKGDPVTVARTAGVIVWGIYVGETDKTGTIILKQKPEGRFKLVALDITPDSLLKQVAQFVGRDDSVTSEEGKHGLIFQGELRSPGEPVETEEAAQEPESDASAEAAAGEFERLTKAEAIAAIRQKTTMEIIDRGVKIRIRGGKEDCEKTAKLVIKGRPTVSSQQGGKHMIEGNLNKSYLREAANQQGPDANGVYIRENSSERSFTALGENLNAVQAACLKGCKKGTMFTIIVNDSSADYFVISSGRKRIM